MNTTRRIHDSKSSTRADWQVGLATLTLLLLCVGQGFILMACSLPEASNRNDVPTVEDVSTGPEQSLAPEERVEDETFTVECEVDVAPGPPLLEQQIFNADTIVRARFSSAKPSYRIKDRIPGDSRREQLGFDTFRITDRYPTHVADPSKMHWYYPVTLFEFDVLEYLKGSGPSKLIMVDLSGYRSGTLSSCGRHPLYFAKKEEALGHAPGMSKAGDKDAILLLNAVMPVDQEDLTRYLRRDPSDSPAEDSEYYGDQELGWFHVINQEVVATDDSSDGLILHIPAGEDFRKTRPQGRVFIPDPTRPNGATGMVFGPRQMSISELRWWIAEAGKLEAEAMSDPHYPALVECLSNSWYAVRVSNTRGGGYSPLRVPEEIRSGQAAGTPVISFNSTAADAPTHWLTGPAAHLLEAQYIDEDDHDTGYETRAVTTRPLPAGMYEIGWSSSLPEYARCGFTPDRIGELWRIRAVAKRDVIHEAFFDPGEAENGEAGYDYEGVGVLSPESFELPRNGGKMTVDRVVWYEDAIEVEFEPHVDLSLYEMDIIELDGTKSLTLPFGSATVRGHDDSRSYTWDHCEQPWHDGDMLMIRIREAGPTGAVGEGVYPRACQPSGATGQGAPETAPTPTSEPEETDATPESDEMPEGAAGSEADPSVPQILDAEEEGKSVKLVWAAPESDVGQIVGYRIYRASPDDADLAVIVEDTGSTETSHLDDTLDYGTTYRYAVAALLADGSESNRSPTISVTTNGFVAEE